jgi:pilus assembly protein CpaE
MPLKSFNIQLTGHDESNLDQLKDMVSQLPGVKAQVRVLKGYDHDFPSIADLKADVLIHFLGPKAEMELENLAAQSRQARPIKLIVYNKGVHEPRLMRLAMQVGARDFIMGPKLVEDTLAAVRIILKDEFATANDSAQSITAVVNAKGGAGASTIACALAYAFATQDAMQTLLLDLDLQFGTQCLRLNLDSPHGLIEAMMAIETLDEVALRGYMAKHVSGLHVLNRPEQEIILPGEIDVKHLKRLIEIAHEGYEEIVVDLPRLIDPVFNLIMEQADHIIVVMQQELSSVRDAQRLIKVITQDLGQPGDLIIPILNRYERANDFAIGDVESVLGLKSIKIIPNDFKNLRMASNLGIPIAEYAPNSAATQAIQQLSETLSGKSHSAKQSKLGRLLSSLFSGA